MSGRATLVASLTEPPAAAELERLAGWVEILEVRADLLEAVDPADLRRAFPGRLLFTLRSRAEGGVGPDDPTERRERLAAAAGSFDLVDLEAGRDLAPGLLERWAPERRIVSWHGPAADLESLRGRLREMSACPAWIYKLVPAADKAREALAPLALLRSVRRDDVAAFASGRTGAWTRLLAPRLGAPLVYGSAGDTPAAAGQPPVARLREEFGLPELGDADWLYGVVGNPIEHSLSPRLHNAIYREQGVPALYLPFATSTFGDFWLDVVESGSLRVLGFELAGLSVTAPFKEVAQAVAGASSPLAERIGSANTLVSSGGVWEAETTDPEGVLGPLRELGVAPRGLRAAVVGAGGAARAAGFGLARAGARVTLANRGVERGRRVAGELDLDFTPLAELDCAGFDLVVNATPLGRLPGQPLPFAPGRLARDAIAIDLAYLRDAPTRLVAEVRAAGRRAVDGREVLLHQALPQYLMMTGHRLPLESGRAVLGLEPAP